MFQNFAIFNDKILQFILYFQTNKFKGVGTLSYVEGFRRSFSYSGPCAWNELPAELKNMS